MPVLGCFRPCVCHSVLLSPYVYIFLYYINKNNSLPATSSGDTAVRLASPDVPLDAPRKGTNVPRCPQTVP